MSPVIAHLVPETSAGSATPSQDGPFINPFLFATFAPAPEMTFLISILAVQNSQHSESLSDHPGNGYFDVRHTFAPFSEVR